nr:hypothetical protein [Tanacetum cinerariifolium]
MEMGERKDYIGERKREEPRILEYHSTSSSKYDYDNDDGSQIRDENEKSYGSKIDSCDENHIEMVTEAEEEERNDPQYTDEQNDEKYVSHTEDEEMKDDQEAGSSKKIKVIALKKRRWEKRQPIKNTNEDDPFDESKFEKDFKENEHLYVPTQPSAKKKKDEINEDDL